MLYGYFSTLVDCVARELPSEVQPMKILLLSERKMNSKANKWEGGRFVFTVS